MISWVRKVVVGIFLMPGGVPLLLAALSSERGRMSEFWAIITDEWWMLLFLIISVIFLPLLLDLRERRQIRKSYGLPEFNAHIEVRGEMAQSISDLLGDIFVETYAGRAQRWRSPTIQVIVEVNVEEGRLASKIRASGRIIWVRDTEDSVPIAVPECELELSAPSDLHLQQLAEKFAKNVIEAWQAKLKTAGPARTLPLSWPAPPSN